MKYGLFLAIWLSYGLNAVYAQINEVWEVNINEDILELEDPDFDADKELKVILEGEKSV